MEVAHILQAGLTSPLLITKLTMSTTELAALGLLAPSKALKSRAVPQTPRATYRVFLHALRHLRDPHVWLIATTHIRSLLKTANKPLPINLPEESEELEVLKTQKERATKHIKAVRLANQPR